MGYIIFKFLEGKIYFHLIFLNNYLDFKILFYFILFVYLYLFNFRCHFALKAKFVYFFFYYIVNNN